MRACSCESTQCQNGPELVEAERSCISVFYFFFAESECCSIRINDLAFLAISLFHFFPRLQLSQLLQSREALSFPEEDFVSQRSTVRFSPIPARLRPIQTAILFVQMMTVVELQLAGRIRALLLFCQHLQTLSASAQQLLELLSRLLAEEYSRMILLLSVLPQPLQLLLLHSKDFLLTNQSRQQTMPSSEDLPLSEPISQSQDPPR